MQATEGDIVEEVQEGPAGDGTTEANCASIGMSGLKFVILNLFLFSKLTYFFLHKGNS